MDVDDIFTLDEKTRLLAFTDRIGLDCRELDVLRNRSDDRIYVVDCNKTPWGPGWYASRRDKDRAIEAMMTAAKPMIAPMDDRPLAS